MRRRREQPHADLPYIPASNGASYSAANLSAHRPAHRASNYAANHRAVAGGRERCTIEPCVFGYRFVANADHYGERTQFRWNVYRWEHLRGNSNGRSASWLNYEL